MYTVQCTLIVQSYGVQYLIIDWRHLKQYFLHFKPWQDFQRYLCTTFTFLPQLAVRFYCLNWNPVKKISCLFFASKDQCSFLFIAKLFDFSFLCNFYFLSFFSFSWVSLILYFFKIKWWINWQLLIKRTVLA